MVAKTGICHTMTEHQRVAQLVTQLRGNSRTQHHLGNRFERLALLKRDGLLCAVLVARKESLGRTDNAKAAMGITQRNGHGPDDVFLLFKLLNAFPRNVGGGRANAKNRQQQQIYFSCAGTNN